MSFWWWGKKEEKEESKKDENGESIKEPRVVVDGKEMELKEYID